MNFSASTKAKETEHKQSRGSRWLLYLLALLVGLLIINHISGLHHGAVIIQNFGAAMFPSKDPVEVKSPLHGRKLSSSNATFTANVDHLNHTTSSITNNRASLVLIVAYMRSGSSFLGELFNQNPDAFYWFEPLEGVYQSLYGHQSQLSLPTDIQVYVNGSFRNIPKHETLAVIEATRNILSCNFRKLPTQLLVSKFHDIFDKNQTQIADYRRCLKEKLPDIFRGHCDRFLCSACPRNLGRPWGRQNDLCFQHLDPTRHLDKEGFYHIELKKVLATVCLFNNSHNVSQIVSDLCQDEGATDINLQHLEKISDSFIQKLQNYNNITSFHLYKTCMNKHRQVAMQCINKLEAACEKADIRSAKVVRMPLFVAMEIAKQLPNINIIFNVRSPMAIANSRNKAEWEVGKPMSLYSHGRLIEEADLACRILIRDLETFENVNRNHIASIRIMMNSYEYLAKFPEGSSQSVYSFIGKKINKHVKAWLDDNTKKSYQISTRWQYDLPLKGKHFTHYLQNCNLRPYYREELSDWVEFSSRFV